MYITSETIIENIKIKGLNASICSMSGTLSWYSERLDITLLATPNWENEKGITPIDLIINDDYKAVGKIVLTGSKSEQLEQYKNNLKNILKTIQTIINN